MHTGVYFVFACMCTCFLSCMRMLICFACKCMSFFCIQVYVFVLCMQMYICVFACGCMFLFLHACACVSKRLECMYVYMYACMFVYTCALRETFQGDSTAQHRLEIDYYHLSEYVILYIYCFQARQYAFCTCVCCICISHMYVRLKACFQCQVHEYACLSLTYISMHRIT